MNISYEFEPTCPKCKSKKWSCWDEQVHDYVDDETGEYYSFPVGYLKCLECGNAYEHHEAMTEFDDDVTDGQKQ